MKEHTKQVLYGTLLGCSFLLAFPFSISQMLHSQDEDSAFFRKIVAHWQKPQEQMQTESVEDLLAESIEQDIVLEPIDSESFGVSPGVEEETKELSETTETEEENEKVTPVFTQVSLDYFDDAFFIGDSRTLGIMEYGGLENTVFFANSGMNVFKLQEAELKVPGMGKVTYEDALHAKTYGKVYVMLGMNEMGYEYDYLISKYQVILDEIMEVQPQAIIYVCANMHLTKEAQGEILNNPDLNVLNERISELADGEKIFYLDINPYYDDEEGNLTKEFSTDGVHLFAKYYTEWVNWLSTQAIAR